MGGWGSGRSGGRPIAEHCLRVDLPWMIRTGRIVPGHRILGTLQWTCGGEPSGSIRYEADLAHAGRERLILTYTRGSGDDRENVRQEIRLVATQPQFGGKRWWMVCPYAGTRCAKLFLPGNGDRFASRKAWGIAYQSQRGGWGDDPFNRLHRLQRKLGCPEGYEEPITRPKGMWHSTFARHQERYWELSEQCDRVMASMMARIGIVPGRV